MAKIEFKMSTDQFPNFIAFLQSIQNMVYKMEKGSITHGSHSVIWTESEVQFFIE